MQKTDYEVLLVINNAEGQEKDNDATIQEAEQFKANHKDFNLRIIQQSFPPAVPYSPKDSELKKQYHITTDGENISIANVGTARKLGMDLAFMR